MISSDKANKLIQIYEFVDDLYQSELKYYCMRHSNNKKTKFHDVEILTIYVFCGCCQQYTVLKQMHSFAKEYLADGWFPNLVSYQTFVYRLNRMSAVLNILLAKVLDKFKPVDCQDDIVLVDSMPIITSCQRNRVGKVAAEITDKGYCSTKNLYYYGLKVHIAAFRRVGSLPYPERIVLTSASECDLNVFEQEIIPMWTDKTIFADKAYRCKHLWDDIKANQNITVYTPIKAVKGVPDEERKRNKAYEDLFSTAVSKVRQPIEALFAWLVEKANVQKASKCRSTNGLMVHIFGKLLIAVSNNMFKY